MKHRSWWTFAVIIIMLTIVGTVHAAVVWGGAPTGPVYLNPGYQFTVVATAMNQGDDRVCLRYTVSPGGATTTVACACTGPNCGTGVGTWVCSITNN